MPVMCVRVVGGQDGKEACLYLGYTVLRKEGKDKPAHGKSSLHCLDWDSKFVLLLSWHRHLQAREAMQKLILSKWYACISNYETAQKGHCHNSGQLDVQDRINTK